MKLTNILSPFFLILFVLISSISFAQLPDCQQALSSIRFQQVKRDLNSLQAPNQRYTMLDGIVRSECLTTYQLAEFLGFISDENDRLGIAISAYPRIINKEDIYDVYNSFAYFSSAFRLHDYIASTRVQNTPVLVQPIPVQPKPIEINFPLLNYPDASIYNGKKNCQTFLSDNDFMMYMRQIARLKSDQEKSKEAFSIVEVACLSTSQAMKLATAITIENDRLELLKKAYQRIYDEGNFEFATQVFTHAPNQVALRDFIIQSRAAAQAQLPPPPCKVNDSEFKTIKDPLANESSSTTRLNIAKQQLPRYKCYTSKQMKEIVALFASSTDKLILAKFAYDYIADKENYFFEVSPLLPSSTDRQTLSTYIASKR